LIRRRVVVRGRVQGVFFRDTTRSRAESVGVAGWVTKCPDGAVEAVFEERRMPSSSWSSSAARAEPRRVRSAEVVDEDPEGLSGFAVR
jgi:acylphosphatase